MNKTSDQFDLSNFRPPNISGKNIKVIILGVLIFLFLYQTWFTVAPEEVGVVTRFGAYVREAQPGLNFKLPFNIETVTKVPVQRQIKQEFGFRTTRVGVRTEYSGRSYREESLMLTGDLNAAQVEWIIQYRITDPYKYLFRIRNAEATLRDLTEAVMREIVGDRTVNEVLTVGRQEIAFSVQEKIQEFADQYFTGIKIDQVVLQDVNPPDEVKASFNEVNEAQQEREKLINQARSEYNQVIPKARGDAQRTIQEARGYALERVNNARGEAARFTAQFDEYRKAKEVTRQRLYLETLNVVLSKVGRKLITDDKVSGILPLFQFDQGGQKSAK